MQPTTDVELIRRARSGDRAAFAALTERHRPWVRSLALRALGDVDDAQDVTQEVFVYAFPRLRALRDPERLPAWLRRLTWTLCADYRRRRGTRRLGAASPALDRASEEANLTERLALHAAVAGLSEAHRVTFLLRYLGGWSEDEVAALLQIPANTVRSRLMTAKRRLRLDLTLKPERLTMSVSEDASTLPAAHAALLASAFPGASVRRATPDPEMWMPFAWRVCLDLPDGAEKTVDLRHDLTPERARQIEALARIGLPTPRLLGPPARLPEVGFVTLTEVPAGENLLLWALGGTPHRLRMATDQAFAAMDRLQSATDTLCADPQVGPELPRQTLVEAAAALVATGGPHLDDPWFQGALRRVRRVAADAEKPLIFSYYLHAFPNFVRIFPGADPSDEPLGWPGDSRLTEGRLAEVVAPYGELRDPLLDLAMVWVYDCYPFVHAGFVERRLWESGVSRREFGVRLALQGLKYLQRELPVARPADGSRTYWEALHGWVEAGLAWM